MKRQVLTFIFCGTLFFGVTSCKSKDFDAEMRAADAAVGLGDYDAAIAAYRGLARSYANDPRRAMVLLKMAELYETIVDDDSLAIQGYESVIKDYPLSEAYVVARERRAHLMEKKGDLDGAIEDYASLIKHFSESPDRHRFRVLLCGAYLTQKNYVQARIEAVPLIEDRNTPKDVREQALFVMAESYFLEDRLSEAAPLYQQMLIEFPNSKLVSEAELHLATCMEEMGYLKTARDMTREAATDYPNKQVTDARLKSIKDRGTKAVELPKEKKRPNKQ